MNATDFAVCLPLLIVSATAVALMIAIAIRRNHIVAAAISLIGVAVALGSLPFAATAVPRQVTRLFILDSYSLLYLSKNSHRSGSCSRPCLPRMMHRSSLPDCMQ